jgi:hypothetical protein
MPATLRTVGAWAYRAEGRLEESAILLEDAHRWLDQAVPRFGARPWVSSEMAAVQALQGNAEEALRWFDAAAGYGYGSALLRLDPRFESISADPRFETLLEREETELAAMRERVERGEVELGAG